MSTKKRFALLSLPVALLCAMSFVAVLRGEDAKKAAVGQPAPSFSLQDQDGKTVGLSDYSGKIVVLEWINPECPFVVRHYKAKTMTTLADKYKDKDVVWLAINSTSHQTTDQNKDWIKQNQMGYPILNDASGTVGHEYSAKTTPNMFVINKDGILVYAGAIDDDQTGKKGASATNYVAKALDEVLAGTNVSTPETKPYGCSVKYK